MNALIYADEYQRLEARLATVEDIAWQERHDDRPCIAACVLDSEGMDVIRRLMHLDDLNGYDDTLAL